MPEGRIQADIGSLHSPSPDATAEPQRETVSSDFCWVDGYVTAVAIGPEAIPPGE